MDIFCIERMRAFKGKGGRVLLKICLPKMDGSEVSETFNSFYSSLLTEYVSLGEELSANADCDVRLIVSYSVEHKTHRGRSGHRQKLSEADKGELQEERERWRILTVRRKHRLIRHDIEQYSEILDVFDLSMGCFRK